MHCSVPGGAVYPAVFYGHFLRKNGIESLPAAVDQYTLAALTVADKFAPYYKVLQPLAALALALPFLLPFAAVPLPPPLPLLSPLRLQQRLTLPLYLRLALGDTRARGCSSG